MSESGDSGHRYTFGYNGRGNPCSLCGSYAHWRMHCPDRTPETERDPL